MYLGEFDFSTNIHLVKITSTQSGYHLESFDLKYFMSGFTWKFGNFLGSFNMAFPITTYSKTTRFQKMFL